MTRHTKPGTSDEVQAIQLAQLNQPSELSAGLGFLMEHNLFYRERLSGLSFPLRHLDDFYAVPKTTKGELVEDQAAFPPYGTNLSFPAGYFSRISATSGTTGRRLKWLDTADSWDWIIRCWEHIYDNAGVTDEDRVFVAFGFGPFLGFWAGFEAAARIGALAVPGGGQSSRQRLDWIFEASITVLLSTPTYALRLVEVAAESHIELPNSTIRTTIHAGEPGANIPATRERIESAFGARCFDHAGLTEVGAWGFDCPNREGMHLIETEFIGEVLSVEDGRAVEDGQLGELVLTNLGRWGMPVLRYRTGDLVRPRRGICSCGSPFVRFEGGVIGRLDDMVQVRGVNVYPSAIESIVREDTSIVEYAAEVVERPGLWELSIQIETTGNASDVPKALAGRVHTQLGLQSVIVVVPVGSLPRYELKAKRFRIRKLETS